MAVRDVRIWKCDRCSLEVETKGSAAPESWRRIDFHAGPMLDDAATMVTRQFCGPCGRAIEKFAMEPPAGDRAARRG